MNEKVDNFSQLGQRTFEIGFFKAISIVATAILVSIVGTSFAIVNTLNNDHFINIAQTARIDALEATSDKYVRKDLFQIEQKNILDKITQQGTDINKRFDDLKQIIMSRE